MNLLSELFRNAMQAYKCHGPACDLKLCTATNHNLKRSDRHEESTQINNVLVLFPHGLENFTGVICSSVTILLTTPHFAVNRLKDEAILKALKQYEATTGIRLELLCKPHGVGAKLAKRSEVCAALFFHMVYIRLEQFCDYGASVKM